MLEATRCGAGASSRNGGFLHYSLTHGIENGRVRFPDEIGQLERLATRNYDELTADLGAPRDRRRVRADRRARRRALSGAARGPRGGGASARGVRPAGRTPRPRGDPGGGPLAALPRRPVAADRRGDRQSRRSSPTACARPRSTPGCRSSSTRACAGCSATRTGVDAITDAGVVHAAKVLIATSAYEPLVQAIGRYVAPVYDYALMTEPLTRAAARLDRLEAPPGHRRQRQPVPLLPAERRQPHPLGRLRRRLPLRRTGRSRPRRPRGDLRAPVAELLHDLPAARGPALHPPLGRRDRHLQPLLGVLRAARSAAAPSTRSATPASASAPAASAGAPRSTCSTAARPRPRRLSSCAAGRCRSRPSRCAAP